MNNYLAFILSSRGWVKVDNDNMTPPPNTVAIVTLNYDILDKNGNSLNWELLEDKNFIEEAIQQIHIDEFNNFSKKLEEYQIKDSRLEMLITNNADNEYLKKERERILDLIKTTADDYQIKKTLFKMKFENLVKNIPEPVITQRELSNSSPIYIPIIPQFQQNDSNRFYPSNIQRRKNESTTSNIINTVNYPNRNIAFQQYMSPAVSTASNLIHSVSNQSNGVKGWDKNAVDTVQNWRTLFKEYKFIYEWILERNYKISTNLNLISVVSSSVMGCFSAFKLWVQDDKTFQASSDIIMLFSNFLIAAITTSSKRYIDDNRNEKIRIYLDDVNKFLGNISSELIKSPEYRINADEFIRSQQELYTKISTNKPNITLSELTNAKKSYQLFTDSFLNISNNGTQTDGENNA